MRARPTYLVDTNVLLRYLVNDDPRSSQAARRLIEEAGSGKIDLEIPFISMVETIHVLERFYRVPRYEIGREIPKLLSAPGVKLLGSPWVLEALESYRTGNASFGDACIAAEARAEGLPVASFDRDFSGFPGIEWFEPK
jgi:predicted nucleic-acid-binding protein